MAMRPALKKIVNLLKESESLSNASDYYMVADENKFEKFIKKHCIRLRNPVPIKAGTKWTWKSSSGTPLVLRVWCVRAAVGAVLKRQAWRQSPR